MDSIAEHVHELLDAGPDAMVIANAQGLIAFVNAQTVTLFGYQREELIGQPLELLMPERYRTAHPALRNSYANEPRARPMGSNLDLYARRRDGSEFPVEISLSPLLTKHGLLVSSAIRDITDRKLIHERLVIAQTLADKANRAKSAFLAAASHNLRQPLQTLSLLNSVLEKTVSDPTSTSAVVTQRAALASVSALLNALLDISKLESGAVQPDITDCSVQEIFRRLKATFEAQARAKGLALLVDDAEHFIRTDKGLFEQMIQNLVANAIRYTRNGMVELRCLHDAALMRVEVLDTGIGIDASQREVIFDDFHQLDHEHGEGREGLGLGLAIVRRIAQLLNLAVEVDSEVGRGSCFAVNVPLGRNAVISVPQRMMPSASIHHGDALVLVIDDDEHVANATRLLLEIEGYRVYVASDMEDAIGIKEEAEMWPDIIVSDYHLGNGSSGVEVIGRLRTMVRRSIPAVLVTGDTSSEMGKAVDSLDDCKILSKPFVSQEFLDVVKHMLSTNRLGN